MGGGMKREVPRRGGQRAAIAVLVAIFLGDAVAAEASVVVAACGNSEGYSYHASVGPLANEPSKWLSDRISSGRITLSIVDGEFDILFGDATGAIKSATQEGAKVIAVGQSDFSISILVVYPMLVENYTFLVSSGGPEVIWTTNKHSTPVVKAGAYRAACKFVNLPKKDK